jgi:hypothetical protein
MINGNDKKNSTKPQLTTIIGAKKPIKNGAIAEM